MSTIDTWGLAIGLLFIIVWIWLSLDDNDDGRNA